MILNIKVKANSKENKVEKISEKEYLLRVKSPAQEGKANTAVIKILSEYFDIPKSTVIIMRGEKNKNKLVQIPINHKF